MSLWNREASVCPSVGKLFCTNRYYHHTHDSVATKLAHDGPQKSPHPRCAQGQGQRSRDTGTSVMSRNVCYTVRSHVLSLHALTLLNTIILSFQYKYQAARCLNIGMSYSVIVDLVRSYHRDCVDVLFWLKCSLQHQQTDRSWNRVWSFGLVNVIHPGLNALKHSYLFVLSARVRLL